MLLSPRTIANACALTRRSALVIFVFLTALSFLAMSPVAHGAAGAQLPPAARSEIDELLKRLGNSGCEFNRNGSWHSAVEAREHLTMKFTYLARKHLLASAEDFIEQGASRSSLSGKAYQVRCGNERTVDSAVWLRAALAQYRRPTR